MRLFPTRPALDVAVAAASVVVVGILLFQPAIVAWGGALIVGLSLARAITLLSVARVRTAGFEMIWRNTGRSARVTRGHVIELRAEVRNRDTRAVRFAASRVVASPLVGIEVTPEAGEVPAGGRLELVVRVRGKRVGQHGLFGLGLEMRGPPGLFEVPLTFANPFGIEVLPAAASARRGAPRSAGSAVGVRMSRRWGDATEFSEIRDHQFGDPLKRVAWKASARRGKLMVRKYEIEEREIVWLLLDASVELWAGRLGAAPLDLAIDSAAELARRHLRAGHEVGLELIASQGVTRVAAGRGAGHQHRLLEALARTPSTLEPERSGLDERGIAHKVLEHLAVIAPAAAARVAPAHLDAIAELAREQLEQAPFPAAQIAAPTPREAVLRSYLAAFGVSAPPRLEPERPRTDALLSEAIASHCKQRVSSLVYVLSPLPDPERLAVLGPVLRQARRTRTQLRWLHAAELPGLEPSLDVSSEIARTAARLRTETERRAAELGLRRLGIEAAVCLPAEALAAADAVAAPPRGHRAA
ncbi:MAG: DUF58 domain-containing protein [Deltaproteobacteria bacterium]